MTRKLIAALALCAVVVVFAAQVASASDYRGRYQVRLGESTTLLK